MSDDLQPFFDAILAAPDDDAPRLELARHLTEQGDARGEHIRLSCELDKLDRDDPAKAALEARAAKLPSFWFFTTVERNFPHSCSVRRGFVHELSCSGALFAVHAERLMRAAPIRYFDLTPYAEGQGAQLAACPQLAKLRRLRLNGGYADDEMVLASPHLRDLRELELSLHLADPAAVAKLARMVQYLKSLRVLSTYYGSIDGSACEALAQLANDLNLELLDLRSSNMPEAGLAKIRSILGEQRVLPRPAPRVPFRYGFLDLASSKLDAAEIRGLIDSGEFRTAVKIVFGHKRIGDEGIAHFARSGAFPNLVELYVEGTGITDAGARILASEATGLERLEYLDLGDIPGRGRNGGPRDGVSDSVTSALAQSPRLPALRKITRGIEHHCYEGGASESTDVTPIKRPDGSVVESVIYNRIWP